MIKLVKESIGDFILEDAGAPMATLNNTPGMGNAVPPSNTTLGSGDKWTSDSSVATQKNESRDFYPALVDPSLEEDSINPTDKIGVAMAKKMKVPIYFKKGKGQTIHQKKVSK